MVGVAAVPAFGDPVVNLNTASSFGLLGGTISITGDATAVAGDVGATTTITGFPPGTATGTVFASGNATAVTAYNDFVGAFNTAKGLTSTATFGDLSASTTFLGNNVYTTTSTAISTVTGIDLTFDAQDNPDAVFIIKVGQAFTVNGALAFTLENGAQANHIFWIIGTDATISVGSSGPITFDGNILAGDTFTMSASEGGSGVLAGTINGCVFAENANTLAGDTNISGGCLATAGTSDSVPEPGSWGLASLGLLLGLLAWRKVRVSL